MSSCGCVWPLNQKLYSEQGWKTSWSWTFSILWRHWSVYITLWGSRNDECRRGGQTMIWLGIGSWAQETTIKTPEDPQCSGVVLSFDPAPFQDNERLNSHRSGHLSRSFCAFKNVECNQCCPNMWIINGLCRQVYHSHSLPLCPALLRLKPRLACNGSLICLFCLDPTWRNDVQHVATVFSPQNPGNTKYVLDGHWFMEIDGNCLKHTVSDGTFPN